MDRRAIPRPIWYGTMRSNDASEGNPVNVTRGRQIVLALLALPLLLLFGVRLLRAAVAFGVQLVLVALVLGVLLFGYFKAKGAITRASERRKRR